MEKVREVLEPAGFTIDPEILRGRKVKEHIKLSDVDNLFPYQVEGVKFITNTGGRCIVGDDMGLGKTVEALTYVRLAKAHTLVVSPASVTYKWQAECEKWVPDMVANVVPDGKSKMEKGDIDIMSYAIMVARYDELIKKPYDLIIYDECHYVKGPKAQRTRVAKALVRGGVDKVLFLSGTPFINHPSELFQILNMLDPVGYSSYFSYAQRYCNARYEMGQWFFPPGGTSNLGELADRLSRVMIRRTKQEVLKDLPELTRTLVPVQIDNMSDYKVAIHDLKEWLKEEGKEVKDPNHVLTKLNVLRQVVGRGKVFAAIEMAESILDADRKVVLFAHHKETVTSLYDALKKYGCLVIAGDTPAKERAKNSNLFLSLDSGIRVMIITIAGAEGIDLYSASDIIFVEREWTPAKEEQAEARLHRIGQRAAVTAWYIVAKKTVDEKLAKVVQEKRKIIGQVIRQDQIVQQILQELEAQ